jgi:hypothetical protein
VTSVAELAPAIYDVKLVDAVKSVGVLTLTLFGDKLRQFESKGNSTIFGLLVKAANNAGHDLTVDVKEMAATDFTIKEVEGEVAEEGKHNALPLPKPRRVSLSDLKIL